MEFKDKANKVKVLFACENFQEIPEKLLKIVLGNNTTIYDDYLQIVGNDTNFIQNIYQYYLADRKELKQDFTPNSLSKLISVLSAHENEEIIYDMCAGTGALTLNKNTEKRFILHEINEDTISSLLFNLALRNMQGLVINGDILSGEIKQIYSLVKTDKYSEISIRDNQIPKYDTVISNPPFNLKNEKDISFEDITIKKSSLNYAFVFEGLKNLNNNGIMAFILPLGVLSSRIEHEYRKYLIDNKLVKAVITVPGSMFESTSIPTCILILSKQENKEISFVNIEQADEKITIHTRGTGKKCHENRVYNKKLNSLSDEQITDIQLSITEKLDIAGFSKTVKLDEVHENDCIITPNRYIDFVSIEEKHRSFEDIIDDINRTINDKNKFKITLNLTIAKKLKSWVELAEEKDKNNELIKETNELLERLDTLQELYKKSKETIDAINEDMFYTDKRITQEKWLTITRSAKNEIKNTDLKELSETFKTNLSHCEMMIRYLNNRENEYLAELRDKLLPLLMNGDLKVPTEMTVPEEDNFVEKITCEEKQKTLL